MNSLRGVPLWCLKYFPKEEEFGKFRTKATSRREVSKYLSRDSAPGYLPPARMRTIFGVHHKQYYDVGANNTWAGRDQYLGRVVAPGGTGKVLNSPSGENSLLQKEVGELKEYIEEVFAEQNGINKDTHMQLELINQTLAELQVQKKLHDRLQKPIGFVRPEERE